MIITWLQLRTAMTLLYFSDPWELGLTSTEFKETNARLKQLWKKCKTLWLKLISLKWEFKTIEETNAILKDADWNSNFDPEWADRWEQCVNHEIILRRWSCWLFHHCINDSLHNLLTDPRNEVFLDFARTFDSLKFLICVRLWIQQSFLPWFHAVFLSYLRVINHTIFQGIEWKTRRQHDRIEKRSEKFC